MKNTNLKESCHKTTAEIIKESLAIGELMLPQLKPWAFPLARAVKKEG